jgi:hypothetical protein
VDLKEVGCEVEDWVQLAQWRVGYHEHFGPIKGTAFIGWLSYCPFLSKQ